VHRDTKPVGKLALAGRATGELVDLLEHKNAWYRREARRILSERHDPRALPQLRKLSDSTDKTLALEGLWGLYVGGGWDEETALHLLNHPSPDVRSWTVRLVGDDSQAMPPAVGRQLVKMASTDPSSWVRSQLASTAKRLPGAAGLPIVEQLLRRAEDSADPHIPLLLWWAIEDKAISDGDRILKMLADRQFWLMPIVESTIVERLARRYLAEKSDAGYQACARLLALAPRDEDRLRLVAAMDQDSFGSPSDEVPAALVGPLVKIWREQGSDPTVTRFLLRLGHPEAYQKAVDRMTDRNEPPKIRATLVTAVGQAARPDALNRLLSLLDESPDADAVRMAALAALEHYTDEGIGADVLARYPQFTPELRNRAIALAASRKAWSAALIEAVAAEKIDVKDVPLEAVRQMLAHNDPELSQKIEARFGKIRPATPGEKMSYVPVLGRVLNAGQGDLDNGHKLYMKHCGTCHTLHGEGIKIGPDLTTADRKNRDALLLSILDPSGYIRPEFVS
ncbi:MAG: c-type cytochrome, partial [Pirellulales bacterium]